MDTTVPAVRNGLMSKVCLLLAPCLALNALGAYVGRDITNTWAVIGLAVVFFLGAFIIKPVATRSVGLGAVLLLGWIFESGIFIGHTIHNYVEWLGWGAVFNAYMFTSFAMCALGAYGFLTSRNLISWAAPLFFALLALLVVMLVGIFVNFGSTGNYWIGGAGMVIFGLLFIFDFNRLKYEEDTWPQAFESTVQISLDYMNFLLFFLQFTGGSKD
jgi:FtsH-binding integral membrane protein